MLADPAFVQVIRSGPMTSEAAPPRARVVPAAVLSVLFPGVGVFYAGRRRLGVVVTLAVHPLMFAVAAAATLADLRGVAVPAVLLAGYLSLVVGATLLSVRTATEGREVGPWHRAKTAALCLVTIAVGAVVPTSDLVSSFTASSHSMAPTLVPGDRFFVNGLRRHELSRGDVIAFVAPPSVGLSAGQVWAKRVLAVEGDVVEISSGKLVVNGAAPAWRECEDARMLAALELLADDFRGSCMIEERAGYPSVPIVVSSDSGPSVPSQRVPPGHVYVVGDNRESSYDSRIWGPLAHEYIVGRFMGVYWRRASGG